MSTIAQPGWRAFWISLVAGLALAACSTLQLSEPYDARIEDGVNAYHRSFIVFAKGLQFAGRGEDGRYDSPAVREFYSAAAAELGNTILRARANNPDGTCPPAEAAALGLDAIAVPGGDEDSGLADLAKGSCTVVTLQVLQSVHDGMEQLHREQNFLSPRYVEIKSRNISAAAEIVITAEQSKRP